MALPAYMSLTGAKQGKIEGSCEIKGHEGKCLVQGHSHIIEIPTNLQTGTASGKRVHEPLRVTKAIDKASPKIMQALTTGELMTDVTIDFNHIDKNGQEVTYFTIKLEDATVIKTETRTDNILNPALNGYPDWEDVYFTYAKITKTWHDGGIEAVDSWKGQN